MGLFIYASFNETGFDCGIHIFLVMKTCFNEKCVAYELQSAI